MRRTIPVFFTLLTAAVLAAAASAADDTLTERYRELPHEVVVMGGHYDSWDVGQGAHDDGASCIAAWQALKVLHRLGLEPRRTLRVVHLFGYPLRIGGHFKSALSMRA